MGEGKSSVLPSKGVDSGKIDGSQGESRQRVGTERV